MSTSGVTAWEVTALEIVKKAMGPLLAPGSEPDSDELTDCLGHLNGMLKSWATRGVSLFREAQTTVTTTPATASVTLNAAVRTILSARVVVSSTNERRLWPVDRTTYLNLPNKTAAGSPTMYYLDRQRDAAVLYLWPVSATAVDIKLDYDRLPETITAGTETIDIRQELHEAVWTNLAVIIRPEVFGEAVPPTTIMRAQMLEQQMFDAERPDSYRFETDFDYA